MGTLRYAFLSHSWHDDVNKKWSILTDWCESFRGKNQRAPLLWLDKTCIDQTSIVEDLECLPVFLGACNSLLIICGPSYMTRLWCIVELFTFVSMKSGEVSKLNDVIIKSFDVNLLEVSKEFDCRDCNCFNPDDKLEMMRIFQAGTDGVDGFNKAVC